MILNKSDLFLWFIVSDCFRFYFLSNDELLELLSESRNPEQVQRHITKLFNGIHRLKFDMKQYIIGFTSPEGEDISLARPVQPAAAKVLLQLNDYCVIVSAN